MSAAKRQQQERMSSRVGDVKARQTTGSRQQHAFREQLANQAAPGPAQGQPDRGLRPVIQSSRQQQVGNVRARNQQQQSRKRRQQPQGQ